MANESQKIKLITQYKVKHGNIWAAQNQRRRKSVKNTMHLWESDTIRHEGEDKDNNDNGVTMKPSEQLDARENVEV